MLRYRILCVGRRARDALLDVADEYLERTRRFAPVELVRVRQGSLAEEQALLLAKLSSDDLVVVLDERGEEHSTSALADKLRRWREGGIKIATFVIGGAEGLGPEIKGRAQLTLSLSKLTLPHRLAQVLLAEQLYRCHTLLAGAPYHRDG